MWGKVAISWFAVLAGAAFVVKFYSPELFDRLTGRFLARTQHAASSAGPPQAKRQKAKRSLASRVEANTTGTATPPLSATEGKANKKRKLVSTSTENKAVARTANNAQAALPRNEDDGVSNKEFAQQLSRAQAGTTLESAKAPGTSKKERRAAAKVSQEQQNGVRASVPSTETSSSTGRDGDDDVSPIGSPSTGAVSTAPTSRAGDISDMLDAPSAKPGILRLVDVKESSTKPTSKNSQSFQPALTKKQRQRQANAADQKSLREESDRLHEQKKQAQLRTARMADGSSNQTKANVFASTSKQNAWQSTKPASEKLAPISGTNEVAPLLDTFENNETTTTPAHGAVTSKPLSNIVNSVPASTNANAVRQEVGEAKANALAASEREKVSRPRLESKASWADEVNEEEQDKWATELAQEGEWESVASKKGKKKSKKEVGDTSSEASSSVARPPVTNGHLPVNGTQANGVKRSGTEGANRFQYIEAAADSSFKDAEWEA